ncbi:amino acid adenylation domain-containing protein [Actinokineospora sp. 24-640]
MFDTSGFGPAGGRALNGPQLGIWYAQRLAPTSPVFTMGGYLEIHGPFDRDAFIAASRAAAAEHDGLRLRFTEVDGVPVQASGPEHDLAPDVVDLSGAADPAAAAVAHMRADMDTVIDPATGPFHHVVIYVLGPEHHITYGRVHHLVHDGLSAAMVDRRVAELYTALVTGAEAGQPLGSFLRVLDEQDAYTGSKAEKRDAAYWREVMADAPRPRPVVEGRAPIRRVAHETAVLDESTLDGLRAVGERAGVTWQHVLVAAAVLHRAIETGEGDVVMGLPLSGRTTIAARTTPGMLADVLPLRAAVRPGDTVAELAAAVSSAILKAQWHQRYPSASLLRELGWQAEGRFGPVVNILTGDEPISFAGTPAVPATLSTGGTADDLTITVTRPQAGAGVTVDLALDAAYTAEVDLAARLRRFLAVLTAIAADPDLRVAAVDALTPDERERVLRGWNDTATEIPPLSLVDLFELAADRDPDALAVIDGDTEIVYGELDARADAVAWLLDAAGVRRGELVGVLLDRGADFAAAVVGVAKAGAGYVVLDPDFPDDRIALVLNESGVRTVLSGARHGHRVADRARVLDIASVSGRGARVAVPVSPDDVACVMFTSGSTGRPKGVVSSHRALVGTLLAQDYATFGRGEVFLQCSPVSWDAFSLEFWGSLAFGGTCVLHPGQRPEPAVVADLVARHGVTMLQVSSSLFNYLVDEHPEAFAALRVAFTGGEPASAVHVARVLAACPGLAVANGYGPAESMGFTTVHPLTSDVAGPVPIGRPVVNKRAYVLDNRLQPTPPGVTGEVYLGGAGLARGYLGKPGLTAERFVADPHGLPGERMYRTGDLARWSGDGVLEFVGRADDQVKVRGFRVEPGEVEAALARCPGVTHAAVIVRQDVGKPARLVGYAVSTVDGPTLRERLADTLPEHLVPAAVVVLEQLPITANGKLDKAALPAPEFTADSAGRAPRDAREELLCGLFAEVLDVESVTVDDSFFDLGGHSLLAARLTARAREVLGVDLGVRDVFAHPTVAALCQIATDATTATTATTAPPAAAERPERVPLSHAQRRLWFLDRLEGAGAYAVPLATRLTGPVDADALAAAIADVVARHETLRTVFPQDGDEPYQHVLAAAAAHLHRETVAPADLDERLRALAAEPFDLATTPPARFALLAVGDEHVLLTVLHHIATDGQSTGPLFADLAAAYTARAAGTAPAWAPLPVQYADYALWQRELLGDPDDETSTWSRELAHWRTALAGLPEELALPRDRPRPVVARHRGGAVPIALGAQRHARLLAVARAERCTPFMVLQAALAATLTRLGAGEDVPIGTPVAGRHHPGLDELVGFFVNTLVLRSDTSGNPAFRDLLGRVRAADLDAYAHQELPFDVLLEALNPVRSLSRHPLFQVCLALEGAQGDPGLPGYAGTRFVDTGTAKFDLEFLFREDAAAGVAGAVVYDADLFDAATVERVLAVYLRLLDQVLADPGARVGDVDVLGEDRGLILGEWTDTAVAVPEVSLVDLFEERVDRAGGHTAVVFGDDAVTYAELDGRANAVAAALGDVRGEIVGVLLDRGVDFAAAVVGVLKAGAGYAVLDPEHPDDRLRSVVAEAGVRVVVTGSAERVPGALAVAVPPVPTPRASVAATPDDVACVMFTSGSTGRPKGVVSSHRALVGTLLAQDYATFGPGEVFLQCSPVSWDAFSLEFWGSLAFGGTCVLHPGQRPEPAVVTDLVARHGVTMLQVSSSLFNHLADEHPEAFAGLRLAFTGGEPASAAHVARVLAAYPNVAVANGYGPAESMGFTTVHPLTADITGSVPVGRPVVNKRAYVLDNRLQPVPIGVTGEVYLGGVGLAQRYLNRPGLTAGRFVADPYGPTGERMYRTGDLARWSGDGVLEFVGRADDQVKVRGFRVEPGEVEAVLVGHDLVSQAAVVPVRDGGDTRLAAYVVAGTDGPALRRWAADRLPEHLVPAVVVVLEQLPITANGKLDKAALPVPEFTASAEGRAPRTPQEAALCSLYSELLGVEAVTIDDGFFDLGGHSLLAARLISRVRTTLPDAGEITVRDVFQAPTAAALAERLAQAAPARKRPALRRRATAGTVS